MLQHARQKLKQKSPKKKKILSSFSKNQTDHRKHTTAKRAGHKKNKSLGCDMREKEY